MATRQEVSCINKSDRYDAHARIKNIGGVLNGIRWKLTQEAAIVAIENGTKEFYVSKGGKTAKLIVSISSLGNKYLKTENDGVQPDNLLSLPECP